jgi:hypothetical protein
MKIKSIIIIGIFALFSVKVYSQFIATTYGGSVSPLLDSLFAYYPFEEASGDALDSHNSYDLTVNGPTVQQTGKVNYCYSYITNDYVGYLDNSYFDFDGSFSLSCWVKTTAGADYTGIMNNGAGSYGWSLIVNSTHPSVARFRLRYDGGSVYSTGTTIISDDAWHHLAVSYSAVDDTMKIWVNGDLEDSDKNINGVWYDSNCRLTIGSIGLSYYYDGEIDEVAIYRGLELTHAQILQLYNSGNGLAYPLDY